MECLIGCTIYLVKQLSRVFVRPSLTALRAGTGGDTIGPSLKFPSQDDRSAYINFLGEFGNPLKLVGIDVLLGCDLMAPSQTHTIFVHTKLQNMVQR
jgi:hypothetical protein